MLSQTAYLERMMFKVLPMLNIKTLKLETTPAKNDLFSNANDEHKTNDLQLTFLSVLMSIAYLAYRTRPDLLAVVSYLSTRVLHKDPSDTEAIIRLLGYIQLTKDKVMTLKPTGTDIIVYTDASYGNNAKRLGQTGVVLTLSHDPETHNILGFIYAMSSKQKSVAQSSAEAELIAQAEGLKYMLWVKNVLTALGYNQSKPMVTFYQDNMAVIQMAHLGTGKFRNTKHIEHRFFLIHNHLESDHITLKHCTTNNMVADLITKSTFTGPNIQRLTSLLLNEKVKVV